jgi:hypothetical protein
MDFKVWGYSQYLSVTARARDFRARGTGITTATTSSWVLKLTENKMAKIIARERVLLVSVV